MNILAVNNSSYLTHNFCQNSSKPQTVNFAQPLAFDTVCFKGKAQTVKSMKSMGDSVNFDLAKNIRKAFEQPHEKLKQILSLKFEDVLAYDGQKGLMTMIERVKTEPSIKEKTATRNWRTKKDIIENMQDVSGFCFIANDRLALNAFIKRIIELVKSKDIQIVEAEYHRLAPKYKRNVIERNYDSLEPSTLQKLKRAIIQEQHPATQFWNDVDSMSGYSALHLIVRTKDGINSEIKFMTRGMNELQRIENVFYKVRNSKSLPRKYKYIEQFLAPLKKPTDGFMTPEQEKLQDAMTKYTQEAYIDILTKPYDTEIKFFEPDNALIEDYDFNKLRQLIEACDKIDAGIK